MQPAPPPSGLVPASPSDARPRLHAAAGWTAWLQAFTVLLLAWATLLCAGLGQTVARVDQTLAGKLAAQARQLQRQAGSALASAAMRRDQGTAATARLQGEARAVPAPTGPERPDLAGWRVHTALPAVAQPAHPAAAARSDPAPAPRLRAHPSRAPPLLA